MDLSQSHSKPGSTKFYKVRSFSRPERTDFKDAFRIYLSNASMFYHKLQAEDLCAVFCAEDKLKLNFTAVAWPESKLNDSVIQLSRTLQEMHGVKLGDSVTISRRGPVKEADSVDLAIVSGELIDNDVDRSYWAWYLSQDFLYRADMICSGMPITSIGLPASSRRSFQVTSVNGKDTPEVFRFAKSTNVRILAKAEREVSPTKFQVCLDVEGIEGIDDELEFLNEHLDCFSDDIETPLARTIPPITGIIFHGPHGVGKTMLLKRIAKAGWKQSYSMNLRRSTEKDIEKIFAEAMSNQPSVITLDKLQRVTAEYEDKWEMLDRQFDLLEENKARVLVAGATTDLQSVDRCVRRTQAFGKELTLPIPKVGSRARVVKRLLDLPPESPENVDELVGWVSERTHGYVIADLELLGRSARDNAKHRLKTRGYCKKEPFATKIEDWESALRNVRPSILSSYQLETPRVRWVDIGGAENTKRAIQEAIIWPLHKADQMARIGFSSTKGVLLYGPPGCSKTLTAKAVATETGINFLAVKGAELLSMYVGESERQLREIFQVARAASPSVLFFDEIDAIGKTRESGPGASNSLNVLTTLLNEIDGIEDLKGVFVLAATNKPEQLDQALLRPGRLDQLLYVGLPDLDSRQAIIEINLRKMDIEETSFDLKEYLANETQGHSGAEIVEVCKVAGKLTMRDQEDAEEGVIVQVGRGHFDEALKQVPRQTTKKMIDHYEAWTKRELSGD